MQLLHRGNKLIHWLRFMEIARQASRATWQPQDAGPCYRLPVHCRRAPGRSTKRRP